MNRTGETLHRIGETLMSASESVCRDASEEDGTYYVPFILICAIKEFQLLGSTLHFGGHQPPDEVARILRMTADHIEGKHVGRHLQ